MIEKEDNNADKWDWNNDIDIIIPFFNKSELLSRCLRSIQASGYLDGKIIIVNDKSDLNELMIIQDVCSELDLDIKLISHDTNKGFRDSVHTGVAECKSKYLILVNSDTIVTYNFAHKLTGVMKEDDTIKAVAPVSNHPTDLYQFRKRLYLKKLFDGIDHQTVINTFLPLMKRGRIKKLISCITSRKNVTKAPYLSANCLALDHEVFDTVGGFSSEYIHGYFEDLDLSCKIRNEGFKLAINEDCFVFHRGQGSYAQKPREWKEELIWKNYYLFKDRWEHLPEHKDLEKRMHWAGREYPI